MSGASRVTITPVAPRGAALVASRFDQDTMVVAPGTNGGWAPFDRGRRTSSASWVGVSAYQLTLPLMLDGMSGAVDVSVEPLISRLESWRQPATGKRGTGLPPVLAIAGPTLAPPGSAWVLQTVEFGDRIRSRTGARIQQQVTLTLLQYVAPTILQSPAKRARTRHGQANPNWGGTSSTDGPVQGQVNGGAFG